jgi:putative membrane protein
MMIGGWRWFGALWMMVFWAGLIALVVWAVTGVTTGHQNAKRPEDIMAERFARGEIERDEFQARRRELASTKDSLRGKAFVASRKASRNERASSGAGKGGNAARVHRSTRIDVGSCSRSYRTKATAVSRRIITPSLVGIAAGSPEATGSESRSPSKRRVELARVVYGRIHRNGVLP